MHFRATGRTLRRNFLPGSSACRSAPGGNSDEYLDFVQIRFVCILETRIAACRPTSAGAPGIVHAKHPSANIIGLVAECPELIVLSILAADSQFFPLPHGRETCAAEADFGRVNGDGARRAEQNSDAHHVIGRLISVLANERARAFQHSLRRFSELAGGTELPVAELRRNLSQFVGCANGIRRRPPTVAHAPLKNARENRQAERDNNA